MQLLKSYNGLGIYLAVCGIAVNTQRGGSSGANSFGVNLHVFVTVCVSRNSITFLVINKD